MCRWVSKERATQVRDTICLQKGEARRCKLESLEKLGGYLEEADYFVEELTKCLDSEEYDIAIKDLWKRFSKRLEDFVSVYEKCIPEETRKRYRFCSKMESLAQLMQMLLKEP